ncbi:zeta toxin family protein [Kribbella sp. NPDC004536]|uniref:zeta toxin family protein n=1 Tax=Kribbella sp. NPDC004536 TaxID=3364106 RepID=UPI003675941B
MRPVVVVITGPVGAGKTTTMQHLAELLAHQGKPVAALDLDTLRALWPANPDDPFHTHLGLTNLSAIWPHFAERGAGWLLLTDIVEHPDQRSDYEDAIPGASIVILRLDVPLDRLHERLRRRESGESLAWHLRRSDELHQLMTERGVGDVVVTVADETPPEVAGLVLEQLVERAATNS